MLDEIPLDKLFPDAQIDADDVGLYIQSLIIIIPLCTNSEQAFEGDNDTGWLKLTYNRKNEIASAQYAAKSKIKAADFGLPATRGFDYSRQEHCNNVFNEYVKTTTQVDSTYEHKVGTFNPPKDSWLSTAAATAHTYRWPLFFGVITGFSALTVAITASIITGNTGWLECLDWVVEKMTGEENFLEYDKKYTDTATEAIWSVLAVESAVITPTATVATALSYKEARKTAPGPKA